MTRLLVSDKYLLYKKSNLRLKKRLDEIEFNVLNKAYHEAMKYLVSIGGANPFFSMHNIGHFRPNGISTTERVFYSADTKKISVILNQEEDFMNTIVFIDINSDHNKQEEFIKEIVNSKNYYLYHTINIEHTETHGVKNECKYSFILNKNQEKLIKHTSSQLVIGAAGSGKSITALEQYKRVRATNADKRTAIITLTSQLKQKLINELIKTNSYHDDCFTFLEFIGRSQIKNDYFTDLIEEVIIEKSKRFNDFKKRAEKYPFIYNSNSIYTLIRGFFKGRLNAQDNYRSFDIKKDKNEIIKQLENSEKFSLLLGIDSLNVYNDLYNIYMTYEDTKKHPDDNDDLQITLKDWDYLIIDEIQDFTEKQCKAIFSLEALKCVYLFGDPNQVINPNFFSFSRLKGIIQKATNIKTLNIKYLNQTYRCGKNLISYINYIAQLRKRFIGSQKEIWDQKELSLNSLNDDNWACFISKNEAILNLIEYFNKSDDCIIITNDWNEKEKFISKYVNLLEQQEMIFTVNEVKGLESKNVILYNIIGSNKSSLCEIFSGNFKKSTLHRMIFNRYYVSLTRARKSTIIIEPSFDSNDSVYDSFMNYEIDGKKVILENLNDDFELIKGYISTSESHEAFYQISMRLLTDGFYEQGISKLKRAVQIATKENRFDKINEYNKIYKEYIFKHLLDEKLKTLFKLIDDKKFDDAQCILTYDFYPIEQNSFTYKLASLLIDNKVSTLDEMLNKIDKSFLKDDRFIDLEKTIVTKEENNLICKFKSSLTAEVIYYHSKQNNIVESKKQRHNGNFKQEKNDFYVVDDKLIDYFGKMNIVEIPNHIEIIGEAAFYECEMITKVIINEGCKYIKDFAFKDCKNLEDIILPSTIISIAPNAFEGCDKLVISGQEFVMEQR